MPIGSGESYRVAARNVNTLRGVVIIINVGESLGAIDHTVRAIQIGLLIVDPGLLIVVGLTVWSLIGRALSPVEAIRSEVEDITARALERRVTEPKFHDEIGRLAVTMNSMLERIAASSQRQRAFVADASHELRSPLAAAPSELDVIPRLVVDKEGSHSLGLVLRHINRQGDPSCHTLNPN